MYKEFYFPEVSFRLPPELMPPVAATHSSETPNLAVEIGRYNQAFENYKATMEMIRNATGANLPLEGRHISFVDMKTLKTAAKQKKFDESYGTYAVEGILGFTQRNIDGTFSTTVGVSGDESVSDEKILLILAHEYGHTIGTLIPDKALEELKAYAFQKLFAKYLSPENVDKLDDRYVDNIHHVAGGMLNQLIERGFPPEAIISTLTWQPFGVYRPTSDMPIPTGFVKRY